MREKEFQFLIGRLSTGISKSHFYDIMNGFQFLIGRLSTHILLLSLLHYS